MLEPPLESSLFSLKVRNNVEYLLNRESKYATNPWKIDQSETGGYTYLSCCSSLKAIVYAVQVPRLMTSNTVIWMPNSYINCMISTYTSNTMVAQWSNSVRVLCVFLHIFPRHVLSLKFANPPIYRVLYVNKQIFNIYPVVIYCVWLIIRCNMGKIWNIW